MEGSTIPGENNFTREPQTQKMFASNTTMPLNEGSAGQTFLDPEMSSVILEAVYYAKLFLFIAGSIGNLFSICIWTSKEFRQTSRSVICSTMAVANTVYITLNFVNSTTWHFSRENILSSSDFSCRMKTIMFALVQHLDSWCIVYLSVERFTAVISQSLMKIVFDRMKALIYVALITATFLAFDVYVAMYDISSWKLPNGYIRCKIMLTLRLQMRQFLIDLIPLLIIIPCNIVIVIKVISQYRKIRHSIAVTQQQTESKKFIKVSILILSITLSFIVLFVPTSVLVLCCSIHTSSQTIFILTLLPMVNASADCYIFVLASKDFRVCAKSALVKIITCVLTVFTSLCAQNAVGPMQ